MESDMVRMTNKEMETGYRKWCQEQILLSFRVLDRVKREVANLPFDRRSFAALTTDQVRDMARRAKAEIIIEDSGEGKR